MRSAISRLAIQLHRELPTFRGKQAFARVAQKLLGGPSLQKTQDGIQLVTRLTSSMDLSFLGEGGHTLIRKEISLLKEGDTFLDVGANTGYFAILAAKRVGNTGRSIAIEPSTREYSILLQNTSYNHVKNLVALNCAASSKVSLLSLELEQEHTGLNRISTAPLLPDDSHQLSLAYPVDMLVPDGISQISLAKIDAEGFELFILQGMKGLLQAKKIKKLIVEISPEFLVQHDQCAEDIYCFLAKYGYKPSPDTQKDLKQWDEVFMQA